jgi:hypothetical protein
MIYKSEKPFNPETPKIKRYEVLNIARLPNGMTSIDFGSQEELGGDSRGILLEESTMEKFNLIDNLKKGMVIDVTTDEEDKVIDVKIIE